MVSLLAEQQMFLQSILLLTVVDFFYAYLSCTKVIVTLPLCVISVLWPWGHESRNFYVCLFSQEITNLYIFRSVCDPGLLSSLLFFKRTGVGG